MLGHTRCLLPMLILCSIPNVAQSHDEVQLADNRSYAPSANLTVSTARMYVLCSEDPIAAHRLNLVGPM